MLARVYCTFSLCQSLCLEGYPNYLRQSSKQFHTDRILLLFVHILEIRKFRQKRLFKYHVHGHTASKCQRFLIQAQDCQIPKSKLLNRLFLFPVLMYSNLIVELLKKSISML